MNIAGPTYTFQRGEPVVIGREVVSGDPTGYTVTAKLKKAVGGRGMPSPGTPVVATFTVEFQAATSEHAARWLLTLDALTAGALAPGTYVVDALFELAGEPVEVTSPAIIAINGSVSG